ncbi:aspartyl-phosphate phosphatase Spo0E family protein (plasmid) [Brevibacillus laterosporus]|nr:aspartyl-phosphate phosphatase Spo0E family protein [Brevibacillus laterosporus]TPG93788.1 aspartyl-phosphate phosphatase Spo0E family protein [Brevibacillus laterosporus]
MEKDIPLTNSKGTSELQNCAITLSQNDCDLQRKTESLRHKLVQLFFKKGSFLHPEVLQMSQQLDEYIVAIQKIRLTK